MLTLICPRCHNPAAHRLQQRSRWFTLFFIPVIPMGFTRFTTCSFCGLSQKVSKQDAANMLATADPQQQVPANHAPQVQAGYAPQGGYPEQSGFQQGYPQRGQPPAQGQQPNTGWQ